MSIYSGCWGIRQQSLHLSLQLRPLLAFAFISGVLPITGEAGKGGQENLAACKASWRRCLGTKKISHSFSVDPLLELCQVHLQAVIWRLFVFLRGRAVELQFAPFAPRPSPFRSSESTSCPCWRTQEDAWTQRSFCNCSPGT